VNIKKLAIVAAAVAVIAIYVAGPIASSDTSAQPAPQSQCRNLEGGKATSTCAVAGGPYAIFGGSLP
jgi:hypothetical protein